MKKLIVQKYGGSSVATVEKINIVAEKVLSYKKKKYGLVVVVSAMGDTTDELIELANRINPSPEKREMDMLLATGEQVSAALLAMCIQSKGSRALSLVGYQVGILTDDFHTTAKIQKIEAQRIQKELKSGKVVIVAGFQGMNKDSDITTLGRGGSDLSAVALAVALDADECQIYTDVEGVYTADPRIVPDARKLEQITFDEMLEMASRGAQVMQTRAVEVAKKFNLPLYVASTFSKKRGTMIMDESQVIEKPVVRGVTLTEKEAKVTLRDVPDEPGIAARIFKSLGENNINVDMIVQNVGHDKATDISFTVEKSEVKKTVKVIKEVASVIDAEDVLADEDVAKISVVGVGMRSQSGIAFNTFQALAEQKINIEMITTSEISISCVVRKTDGKKALLALHKKFDLQKK